MDNETKIQNQLRRGIMEYKKEWRMEDIKLIQRIEYERYNINLENGEGGKSQRRMEDRRCKTNQENGGRKIYI